LFDAPDKLHLNDYDAKIDEFEDELLIPASQMYEKSKAKNDEEAIDQLLLEASQEVEKPVAKCEHNASVTQ